jgi:GTPase
MFRARIQTAFAVTGLGTFVAVEILDGAVKVGDPIDLPLLDGRHRVVDVRAVEFIDHIADARAEVALGLVGVEPREILVGGEVRGKSD